MEAVQGDRLLREAELHAPESHRDGRKSLILNRLQTIAITRRREGVFVGYSGLSQNYMYWFCDPTPRNGEGIPPLSHQAER